MLRYPDLAALFGLALLGVLIGLSACFGILWLHAS
jgi:hypothetical protein